MKDGKKEGKEGGNERKEPLTFKVKSDFDLKIPLLVEDFFRHFFIDSCYLT